MLQKIKLFCWPYAGGSASFYLSWRQYLGMNIEIIPVQLSGRGERYTDKAYKDFLEIAQEGYEYIIANVNLGDKFALFGHSMGSWVVYEICKKIKNTVYENDLVHVFFSANRAPYYEFKEKQIHKLPTDEFISEILKLGSGKHEILENKDFGQIFVDILRNDYTLIEEYICGANELFLNCNISVFNGIQDNIPYEGLLVWNKCTKREMKLYNFQGNHFFIDSDKENVITTIEKILCQQIWHDSSCRLTKRGVDSTLVKPV